MDTTRMVKWRRPRQIGKRPALQEDAFSSPGAANREPRRNEAGHCKTNLIALGDLPVGGSTGACHVASAAIGEAARWYACNRHGCERPAVAALRRRFGLTVAEAGEALCEASRLGEAAGPPESEIAAPAGTGGGDHCKMEKSSDGAISFYMFAAESASGVAFTAQGASARRAVAHV